MITCTSDRSGIASRRMLYVPHTPRPMRMPVSSRTRNLFRIENSMILAIMAVDSLLRGDRALHGAAALHRGGVVGVRDRPRLLDPRGAGVVKCHRAVRD